MAEESPKPLLRDFEAERQAERQRRRAERRTIDEIRDWIISTPEERHKILAQLPGRKERSGL